MLERRQRVQGVDQHSARCCDDADMSCVVRPGTSPDGTVAVGFVPAPPVPRKIPARVAGLPTNLRFTTLHSSSSSFYCLTASGNQVAPTHAADIFHALNNALYVCWIFSRDYTSSYQLFRKELLGHVYIFPFLFRNHLFSSGLSL